jgi:hypothetical protein
VSTVTRAALYEEVWTQSILKLAKKYQISNVALAKICHKLHVPTPPRGYWARIRHGYRVSKPDLPALPPGVLEQYIIRPTTWVANKQPIGQSSSETDRANSIEVPLSLPSKPHPLVEATKNSLEGGGRAEGRSLSVFVSKESRSRALRILHALLSAAEQRGMKVEVGQGRESGSFVLANEERLRFSLEEKNTRVDIPASKRKNSWDPKYESKPTGKLTFRIHAYWPARTQKSWSDGVRQKLEDQLNEICVGFVNISLGVKKHRVESQKRMAQFHEESRIRGLEGARKERLKQDLEGWVRAREIRSMVQALRVRKPKGALVSEFARWANWAEKLAMSFDPVIDGFDKFIEGYEFDEREGSLLARSSWDY